ncbi:MAG: carboxypeptidase-like regulatory domain-containing protein [Edaphobacter sp.]
MPINQSLMSHNPPRLSTSVGTLMACFLAIPSLCYSAALTGTVRNKTTNRPDAGKVVALLVLTEATQEVAHTRTDAAGRYSIELPEAGIHLIRVEHGKVAYFTPVPAGTTHADVNVYDVAPKVDGVTAEADMRRVETDQRGLYVVENYFVSNNSSPPRTQFSSKAFEIYLPPAAQLEASGVMGPEGMPIASSPVPGRDKGHYSFVFPVRPGRTRFQVSYHLPYNGSYTFQSRVSLPTNNLAVAIPGSMKFVAGNEASFQSINGGDPSTQIFVARNVEPSQLLAFTVSGNGALPRDAGQKQSDQPRADSARTAPAPDIRSSIGLGAPIGTPDPLNKYKWWIMSGVALALVIAAFFLLRSRWRSSPAATQNAETAPTPAPPSGIATQSTWLDVLKQELFSIETERLQGKLSETEYKKQKAALEAVLKRALIRLSAPAVQKDC